ncbi:unnamed protein product [Cuscuta epithymum]|uniref:DUF4283 domain-containing protein n=1 Tax=Cuscuta epithymum TaxID=186058 RepID=A0AAV0CUG5_9ASTE|nr:unnamed protein product [Cuscuta epithymum]
MTNAAAAAVVTPLIPSDKNVWKKKSFAEVLSGSSEQPFLAKTHHRHKGLLVVQFPDYEARTLEERHKRSLVGYFFKGRPNLSVIRKSFEVIGFAGVFQLGVIDPKHVLIRFDSDEDFIRCWDRQSWSIHGHLMRVTKWTPAFQPNVGATGGSSLDRF